MSVAANEKYPGLPEYDETIVCGDCGDKASTYFGMHGVFGGGGPGRYTMCGNCGRVLSKTCDTHEGQNEPTEIKAPDVQDAKGDGS